MEKRIKEIEKAEERRRWRERQNRKRENDKEREDEELRKIQRRVWIEEEERDRIKRLKKNKY